MSGFYVQKTGWLVMNTQKQFLTTKVGKAEWTNSLICGSPLFFDSEEEANQRISRIKTDAKAILVNKDTPTKKIYHIQARAHGIVIDVFEVPKFCDKWDSNSYYALENVKIRSHNLIADTIKNQQKELEKLKAQIAKLESLTDDDLNKEINTSLTHLEYRKELDTNRELERKKKEEKL